MSKSYFSETCDDPECVFCQDDDGDAAFWDEFFYASEEETTELKAEEMGLKVFDEETGETIWVENVETDRPVQIIAD